MTKNDTVEVEQKSTDSEFQNLIADKQFLQIPKVGEIIKGQVISASKNEVRLDIEGITTGIVRGRELWHESDEYADLKPGDEVEATVLERENENGEMELSFRFAGHQKAWETLLALKASGEITAAKVIDANKGGLMIKLAGVMGFLPVSQLSPEHYPRVPGGDKAKILEKLRSFITQEMEVKVLDAAENEEKLIVSEKAAWEESQRNVISSLKVGDEVEGNITALTDFGVFVEFGEGLEGLVHISEIAWQRIDHPGNLLKVGQIVKAKIISLDGSKIFLSMKALLIDPWAEIEKKYKVGDQVRGKVLKINPFGLFVELDQDIHGLAHVSELSRKPINNPHEVAKIGDELDFRIVSLEPKDHRLGLSIKALHEIVNDFGEAAKKKEAGLVEAQSVEDKKTEAEKTEAEKTEAEKTEAEKIEAEKTEAEKIEKKNIEENSWTEETGTENFIKSTSAETIPAEPVSTTVATISPTPEVAVEDSEKIPENQPITLEPTSTETEK